LSDKSDGAWSIPPLLFRGCSGDQFTNAFTILNHEYQKMTMQFGTFVFTTLLGSVLAISGMQGKAEGQAAAQPPEQAVQPQNPDETEEEKEKKRKKKQLQEQQQQQQRQTQLQEQQEQQLQQQRQQQLRQLQQKRVSQQEQQERIRKQEQQLALYRKNIALREELAERDAQILRQQKRI
jgi:type IV secretory pathway VirB10-like protein